jgi:nitroimidazol reductase NimA-like FMN-containing flavoprotein (pyridoxamine 5'-phosphate oxidase superfamily)
VRDALFEELSDTECRELLAAHHLGRLALVAASVSGRRIAIPADLPFTWWG